jgi:hypothetical protein
MWRVPGNILNKQSGQPTRGGPPAWGLGYQSKPRLLSLERITMLIIIHNSPICIAIVNILSLNNLLVFKTVCLCTYLLQRRVQKEQSS